MLQCRRWWQTDICEEYSIEYYPTVILSKMEEYASAWVQPESGWMMTSLKTSLNTFEGLSPAERYPISLLKQVSSLADNYTQRHDNVAAVTSGISRTGFIVVRLILNPR